MNLKHVATTCPYCGAGCGFYLKVKEGELAGVIPSKNHPVSQGRLCIKGITSWQSVIGADRIKKPLVKKNGEFKETSWDKALDLVAEKLTAVREKHGPDSLGVWGSARCTNELNYLAQKLARAVLGTNNVDHCARTCHSPTVAGLVRSFGSGAMTNSIDELKDSACIFAVGSNAPEAHPLIGWRIITAKDKGARIIVCDPRKTDMAQYADFHIQHYPGTDIALLNCLMNVIISEGLEDKEYVRTRTEGFEELKKAVAKYTPEYTEPVVGVSSRMLAKAARLYATTKPASIIYTLGITEHTVGTENVMSVANLAMLTGNVGIESGGVNPLRGQNNVQGACDMAALPNVYPGYQKVDDPQIQQKFEKAWDVKLSPKPGLTLTDQLIQAREGNIKGLYIIGEDPLTSDPNITEVRKALESLEFLVVHEIYMTPTAKMADVVLPGASFAEKTGTFTNSERRVQLINKAIEPICSSRGDWEIVCDVATRMGYPFEYADTAGVMDEIASLTPIYGGISHDRIRKVGLQWPCLDKSHPGTKYLHKDKFSRGLGKFHAIEHRPPAEVPDEQYPFILSTGRIRFHYNVGTMSRRTHLLDREHPFMFVEVNTADGERLSIRDMDDCTVSTRRGQLTVKARVSDRVKQGVLWMPFHFVEAPANLLTNDAFCPIARTGEYKACAARLEKAK
ncbi:MAG TPA: formate dehydrogenase subunit alpha [Planctomycetes bacterium]|nr:formate dehydrogenase subunit alpha [Planctomycetota bacterium]HIJ69831.1 formate dehydrogenase subunit alpha [Planctomycetota bacterium]